MDNREEETGRRREGEWAGRGGESEGLSNSRATIPTPPLPLSHSPRLHPSRSPPLLANPVGAPQLNPALPPCAVPAARNTATARTTPGRRWDQVQSPG